MRLRLPRFLRPVFYAVLLLALAVCGTEIALRVQDSMRWRAAMPATDGDGLVVPSWTVHHEMKPLRRVEFVNPDDQTRVVVRTSSFGTRGGEPAVPKPARQFRILLMGDEVVLGPDVPEEATAASRLADFLGTSGGVDLEVLNAGVPGDCPLLSYLRFRHSLASLRPDVVIVTFDMGDVADDYHLRRHVEVADGNVPVACPSPLLRRAEELGGRPAEQFLLPKWGKEQLARWTLQESGSGGTRAIDSPRGRFGWLREQRADWDVYVDLAFSPLDQLKAACDEVGCTLVVAAHPSPWQVSAGACCERLRESVGVGPRDVYPGREPFERLGEYLAERKIAYCDGSEAFRSDAQPDTLFLVNAPRFTERGHELHARVLATYLRRRVVGPWRSSDPSLGAGERRVDADGGLGRR